MLTNSDNELAEIRSILRETAELIRAGNQHQQDQHERIIKQLELFRDISNRQNLATERNADITHQLTTLVGEQSSTVAATTRLIIDAIEASRTSTQALQEAAILAQSSQATVRDLIAELRNR